ncbi:sensor domain-containing diguanylate cyclase [Dechloromonas denitrificans]|uniref:sensor domain-containing diguanylate cyclase n=1 Tax=Dechloromonas denitrificans TaxID=281362 RepID=UPI001CF8CAD4|nr:sensor domain-containing diguanylate cyclase [Dechloromonas denitrificans]UCV03572.1 GGDEF domain-containing protein [Dechloromonas denitrificans]UCV07834.1 GGDEF domain-containing protein [Dechloromonas denitrificans]
MIRPATLVDRYRLILLLSLLLSCGFFATTLFGYFVSKQAIRSAIIGQDLPLTSSNIYSEIQKDLVRPVLISSTMAHDTFLRDWVLNGERNVDEMARYLAEVKDRHGAFSSFFVAQKSGNYYTGTGILKRVSEAEPRDAWYYRVRDMKEDYEINVDLDLANRDAMTIFINYRVHDFSGNYIGATGIGLTVDAVRRLIDEYQQRFHRTIYFADATGRIVFGNQAGQPTDLRSRPGLGALVDRILQEHSGLYQFEANGDNHILNVNYVPELKWYLFVEQNEDVALAGIRQTFYANLGISFIVTVIVIFLTYLTLHRYQSRIEEMASTDELTGLLNRHAFGILVDKLMAAYRRTPRPITFLLADIDYFKSINDRYGHRTGDQVLVGIAGVLKAAMREADFAVRWGGEEFLLVLQGCAIEEGEVVAEKLRQAVEAAHPCATDGSIGVTVSIGVSQYDGSESPDQTVNRADAALYAAKGRGRNQVCLTPPAGADGSSAEA